MFLLLSIPLGLSAENTASRALSAAEQFKEFTSSPKAAVSVQVTISAPHNIRANGTNYHERGTTRIQCSWTPTLLAYTAAFEVPGWVRGRTDVMRDNDAFSVRTVMGSTNESWPDGSTITWHGSWGVPVDIRNPVLTAYKRARDHFGLAMNLGISEAEVGTLSWQGHHLSAGGYSISQPVTFQGTLAVDETGIPACLDFKRTSPAGILNYEIHYGSSLLQVEGTNGLRLPACFDVFRFVGDRKAADPPVQQVAIEKIALISADQVRREVDTLTLLARQMTNQFLVQGGTLFARLPDGTLIPEQAPRQPTPFLLSYSAGKRLYWATTTLLAIGFLLFLGRGVRKTHQLLTPTKGSL